MNVGVLCSVKCYITMHTSSSVLQADVGRKAEANDVGRELNVGFSWLQAAARYTMHATTALG